MKGDNDQIPNTAMKGNASVDAVGDADHTKPLERIMSLGSNINVWNTCLRILRLRGYTIELAGELDEDGCWPADALWIAEKKLPFQGGQSNRITWSCWHL